MHGNTPRHDPPRGDRRELRDDTRHRDDIAEQIDRLERARGGIKKMHPPEELPTADEGRAIAACNLPVQVGETVVRSVEVQDGRPQHGAMPSGAHIRAIEVSMPNREMRDCEIPAECPSCGCERSVYGYGNYNGMAGHMSLSCERCGEAHREEDW